MRQVIENGNKFNEQNFFILMEQLDYPEKIDITLSRFIRIFVEELGIKETDFLIFLS